MKERILVTGGTGYIGSHTVVELQNSGYEVIIIDNLSNSNADVVDNIEKVSGIRPAFEKLDCLDFAGLALVLFAGLREQMSLVKVPKGMQGTPIALITAGLLAMAFMGFSGVV